MSTSTCPDSSAGRRSRHLLPSGRVAPWQLLALGSAAVLLTPAHAHAQSSDPAAAEALFTEGREAMARGDFDLACDRLTASLALERTPGTLLNLGACEEHRQHLALAWQHFLEARRMLPASDERVSGIDARIRVLDGRVPRLAVVWPAAPTGGRIVRDGVELPRGSWGALLPTEPGRRIVQAFLGTRTVLSTEVVLEEGERVRLLVAASSAAEVPPAQPAASVRPIPAAPRWPQWVTVAGGTLLAAGAAMGLAALVADKQVGDACSRDGLCRDEGIRASGRYQAFSAASTITLSLGLGATAVGVAGFVWSRPSR